MDSLFHQLSQAWVNPGQPNGSGSGKKPNQSNEAGKGRWKAPVFAGMAYLLYTNFASFLLECHDFERIVSRLHCLPLLCAYPSQHSGRRRCRDWLLRRDEPQRRHLLTCSSLRGGTLRQHSLSTKRSENFAHIVWLCTHFCRPMTCTMLTIHQ